MKLKPYTYTFNFITHILVHLVIVNTLEQSCTLDMSVKIKCIIIIIIIMFKHVRRACEDIFFSNVYLLLNNYSLKVSVINMCYLLCLHYTVLVKNPFLNLNSLDHCIMFYYFVKIIIKDYIVYVQRITNYMIIMFLL